MTVSIQIDVRDSLENVLNAYGRTGGPTQFGWHTIDAMFRCWKEYRYTQEESCTDRNKGSNRGFALYVGTILHEFLAGYYGKRDLVPLTEYLLSKGFEPEVTEAKRLYDAYLHYYTTEQSDSFLDDDTEIIAIEKELRRDMPWGQPYTVRLDMAVRKPSGVWVIDHKTSAMMSTEFVEGWQTEPSILGLIWCADQVWPNEVRGVIINGIVKTKTPKMERMTFARNQTLMDGWMKMLQHKRAELGFAEINDWPQNYTACFRKMGPFVGKCRYYERCIYGVEADDMSAGDVIG